MTEILVQIAVTAFSMMPVGVGIVAAIKRDVHWLDRRQAENKADLSQRIDRVETDLHGRIDRVEREVRAGQ